jgi:DNA-binding transcriptional LysR family regulator
MLDHADVLSSRIDLASTQLGELAAAQARTLRVGASPSALATFVPAAVEELLAGREELEIGIVEGSVAELAGAVGAGELHAAVCFQDAAEPRREHTGTRRIDLFEEPFRALVPPKHRLAERRRIRLRDLADDVWTMPSRTGLVVRACVEAGFEPRIGYVSTDPLAICGLVARGLAVTLTPASLAPELPRVRPLAVTGPTARRVVYALLPEAGAGRLASDFLEALRSVTAGFGSR